MKINALVLKNRVFKFMPGAIILLSLGIIFDSIAVASTFNMQENKTYNLNKLSDFSLKFNDDIYNQLEREILKHKLDFSEYIDLIDSDRNKNEYNVQTRLNILVQSQTNSAENLWDSFLDSLSQLQFETFSANSSSLATIPILPQVNYRDIYKEVYDFDITLANSSQIRIPSRRVPRTAIRNQIPQDSNKYFSSYFQENRRPDYSLFLDRPRSINNNNSSLSVPDGQSPNLATNLQPRNLANLANSPIIDLSIAANRSQFAFIRNTIDDINKQNYVYGNDDNSQIVSGVEPVYIPSTDIEIYQFNNFDVASALDNYKKSEYQKRIDKNIKNQKKEVEKQRKKMYKNLLKRQKERERARIKQLKEYRKQRKKALAKAMREQKKLQREQQRQLR